jgi:hypothetical protein
MVALSSWTHNEGGAVRSLLVVGVMVLALGLAIAVFGIHNRYSCEGGSPFTTSRAVAESHCSSLVPVTTDDRVEIRWLVLTGTFLCGAIVLRLGSRD